MAPILRKRKQQEEPSEENATKRTRRERIDDSKRHDTRKSPITKNESSKKLSEARRKRETEPSEAKPVRSKKKNPKDVSKAPEASSEPEQAIPSQKDAKESPAAEKAKKTRKAATKPPKKTTKKAAIPDTTFRKELSESPQPSESPSSFEISTPLLKAPISCHLYRDPDSYGTTDPPCLIFTHGAGGTLSAPAVVDFCRGFALHSTVLAFQGSMNLAARVKGFHAVLEHYPSTESRKGRIFLGGRSMGARAAVIAASELITSGKAKAEQFRLVLVSYALQGPKGELRDQILLDLPKGVEAFFIIGSRDGMCPIDTLSDVRRKMRAWSGIAVVQGADHGMHLSPQVAGKELGKAAGRTAAMFLGSKHTARVHKELWWDESIKKVVGGDRAEDGSIELKQAPALHNTCKW